jgi:hypothetical protein
MPTILATLEAEIRKIMDVHEPGQESLQDPHLNGKKPAMEGYSIPPG